MFGYPNATSACRLRTRTGKCAVRKWLARSVRHCMHEMQRSLEAPFSSIESQPCSSINEAPGAGVGSKASAAARDRKEALVDRLGFIAPLCLAAENAAQALHSAARFSALWSDHA